MTQPLYLTFCVVITVQPHCVHVGMHSHASIHEVIHHRLWSTTHHSGHCTELLLFVTVVRLVSDLFAPVASYNIEVWVHSSQELLVEVIELFGAL